MFLLTFNYLKRNIITGELSYCQQPGFTRVKLTKQPTRLYGVYREHRGPPPSHSVKIAGLRKQDIKTKW